MPAMMDENGVFRPQYLMHRVAGGRLSTANPSLHTMPWHSCSAQTRVNLLNGTSPTMKELFEQHKNGTRFWVYSLDSSGKVVPGHARDVYRSEVEAPIWEIELDNGEVIECTGNHPFRVRDGSYINAQDLQLGTSLSPLYTKDDGRGYEMIYDLESGRFVHTHIRVCDEVFPEVSFSGMVRHHIDYDKRNNSPDNLQLVNWTAHRKLHNDNVHATLHTPEAKET